MFPVRSENQLGSVFSIFRHTCHGGKSTKRLSRECVDHYVVAEIFVPEHFFGDRHFVNLNIEQGALLELLTNEGISNYRKVVELYLNDEIDLLPPKVYQLIKRNFITLITGMSIGSFQGSNPKEKVFDKINRIQDLYTNPSYSINTPSATFYRDILVVFRNINKIFYLNPALLSSILFNVQTHLRTVEMQSLQISSILEMRWVVETLTTKDVETRSKGQIVMNDGKLKVFRDYVLDRC